MPTLFSPGTSNNVTNLFQQTLANSAINIGNQPPYARTVFTFTSTQRLAILTGGVMTKVSDALATNTLTQAQYLNLQAGSVLNNFRGVAGLSPSQTAIYAQSIAPININLSQGVEPANAIIAMAVNPNSITWQQPKRFNKMDTMTGSTFFHFLNADNQNIDILTMTFRGQTGNIDLNNPANLPKLQTWHALYNITREPQLIGDSIINDIYIGYYTKLFPMKITLIGFFSKVMEFTEDANEPNNRHYEMAFTVKRTSPSLDVIVQQVNSSLVANGV